MATPPPPTIPELIESLGPPRSYAEQVTIERMRSLERDAAKFPELEYAFWTSASDLAFAVRIFREHGNTPPIANYPNRPAE